LSHSTPVALRLQPTSRLSTDKDLQCSFGRPLCACRLLHLGSGWMSDDAYTTTIRAMIRTEVTKFSQPTSASQTGVVPKATEREKSDLGRNWKSEVDLRPKRSFGAADLTNAAKRRKNQGDGPDSPPGPM
jgi:hypothetical protein